MKRIGLIGGTSWVSTLYYYRFLNELANERLGGHHSADIVLRSLDFQPLIDAVHDRRAVEAAFIEAAGELVAAGAELLAVSSVTGHKFADPLEARGNVPLGHVAEATRQALLRSETRRVGIIGTSFTMKDEALIARLVPPGEVEAVLPSPKLFSDVDAAIFGDLMKMRFGDGTRRVLRAVMADLEAEGADTILLSCTELVFAREWFEAGVPILDATKLHCQALADAALAD
jgi:aspartate racemase